MPIVLGCLITRPLLVLLWLALCTCFSRGGIRLGAYELFENTGPNSNSRYILEALVDNGVPLQSLSMYQLLDSDTKT